MYSLKKLLYINTTFGFIGGLVSAFVHIATNFPTISLEEIAIVIFCAPIFQAILLILYTLVGFFFTKKFLPKVLS